MFRRGVEGRGEGVVIFRLLFLSIPCTFTAIRFISFTPSFACSPSGQQSFNLIEPNRLNARENVIGFKFCWIERIERYDDDIPSFNSKFAFSSVECRIGCMFLYGLSLGRSSVVGEKAKTGWNRKNIGERHEPSGGLGRGNPPPPFLYPDYRSACFARPFFSAHADFPFFQQCGAWSQANVASDTGASCWWIDFWPLSS